MFALQNSNKVHTTQNSQSTTKPLPPPTTQKELENRVKEAQLIRAESKAQANEIRAIGKTQANEIRATGKTQANELKTSATGHGQKAVQAQKGLEAHDETISKAQAQNAKFAAILARKKANS